MDRLRVTGGRELRGSVAVSGAKNAALPIMAASLLATKPVTLHRVPRLQDIITMSHLLERLGATVETDGHSIRIDPRKVTVTTAPYDLVRTMRASFWVLGPLLARFGKASVSQPGGCAIGVRPVDLHVAGLRAIGARVSTKRGMVSARADQLAGGEIDLPFPSVGATAQIMMAAARAKGRTVIANAACEPEIADLARFLTALGAHVTGAGTNVLMIQGRKRLGGAEHTVIPDRIEAATLMIAAAITRCPLSIRDVEFEDIKPVVLALREAGVEVKRRGSAVRISVPNGLAPVNIRTQPHPGFPTDVQAQMMALLTTISGTSTISETIFENRFMHVSELQRMGANIQLIGNTAIIHGGTPLSGAPVMASDLRASAALVLAGLVAKGDTVISRIYHLDRGYERIDERLAKLGADIRREPGDDL